MNRRRIAVTFLAISFSGMVAAGCKKDDGPLEEAGEKIDEAVNDAKRKVEDAAD